MSLLVSWLAAQRKRQLHTWKSPAQKEKGVDMSVASRLDLAMGEAGPERGTQRGRARENRKEGGRQTVRQTDGVCTAKLARL